MDGAASSPRNRRFLAPDLKNKIQRTSGDWQPPPSPINSEGWGRVSRRQGRPSMRRDRKMVLCRWVLGDKIQNIVDSESRAGFFPPGNPSENCLGRSPPRLFRWVSGREEAIPTPNIEDGGAFVLLAFGAAPFYRLPADSGKRHPLR